jgi:hypothetical protein
MILPHLGVRVGKSGAECSEPNSPPGYRPFPARGLGEFLEKACFSGMKKSFEVAR